MKKPVNTPNEEFVIKFWTTNEDGFKVQEQRSYRYHSKNRHDQAKKDCAAELRKEGKQITIISCSYQ